MRGPKGPRKLYPRVYPGELCFGVLCAGYTALNRSLCQKVGQMTVPQITEQRKLGHFTGNRNGDSNLGAMPGLQPSLMSRPSKLRLILAEDHPVLREGLSLILDLLPDMAVAGQASTGEEAFELFLKLEPDV